MADPATKRRVYVYCRPIFSGENAQVRKAKKVKELIDKNRSLLLPLLNDVGDGPVVDILRQLLSKRIFESTLRAKSEFPDLFPPSTLRAAQRLASETDASRSTAELLDEIASQHDGMGSNLEDAVDPTEEVRDHGEIDISKSPAKAQVTADQQNKMPSLYPSYLPYETQHLILNTAQRVLEECCFDFAKTSMPSLLAEKKWSCPAAVELTGWTRMFRRNMKLDLVQTTSLVDLGAGGLQGLLTTVSSLRHTAVHRVATTARDVGQLLESAVKLALLLGDNVRAAQLEDLRSDLHGQVEAMELNKNVLEDTTACRLREIQEKRHELDKMEDELIQEMLRDDMVNKLLIGRQLENSVNIIFNGKKDGPDEGVKEDDDGDTDGEKEKEDDEEKGDFKVNGISDSHAGSEKLV